MVERPLRFWPRGHNLKGPQAWSSGGSLIETPAILRNYHVLSTTSVGFIRNSFLIHRLVTALTEAA